MRRLRQRASCRGGKGKAGTTSKKAVAGAAEGTVRSALNAVTKRGADPAAVEAILDRAAAEIGALEPPVHRPEGQA